MPQRSSRVTATQEPAAPSSALKRRLPARDTAGSGPRKHRRQQPSPVRPRGGKPARRTATRSKYFGHSDPNKSGSANAESMAGSGSSTSDPGSKDEWLATTTDEADNDETDADDVGGETEVEKQKPRGRKCGRLATRIRKRSHLVTDPDTTVARGTIKGQELWREGIRTGLGPGKEVFIKKPQARDPGDTPYRPDTIHPNTLRFLQDLAENNERQWLKAHDADYRAAKQDMESFAESLTEKIIEQDSTIPELPVKDLVFRIHRDIRFSNDPTPYKTHFSAVWSRTGKKGPYAAYIVQLQPGSSFIGCGLWMPDAGRLALVRRDIDRHPQRIKAILRDTALRNEIFQGIPDDEKHVVQAFVAHNHESALKTKPKGYEADHPNIDLLRLRSFTLGRTLTDDVMVSLQAQNRIVELIGVMVPLVTYLNSVVMPDPA